MFKVGQKVVCVDDSLEFTRQLAREKGLNIRPHLDGLTKGNIYTIRENGCKDWMGTDFLCVRLVEITNRPEGPLAGKDTPYAEWRFKPLEERKTDISLFKEMLIKPKEKLIEEFKALENVK